MRRLARAGFKGDFVRSALLPDWWEDACADDASLLPDIEIRVARFLGVSLDAIRHPRTALSPVLPVGAQLRRVHDIDRDRLAPAIHAALEIGRAVVRSLRSGAATIRVPPADGLAWRKAVLQDRGRMQLDDVVHDLWSRGIPVVPVEVLPAPSFQGAVCVVEGRPVIVLGHKLDAPGRVAFLLAHEVGHLAAGDCSEGHPVFDEEEEVADDAEMERRADRFAMRALVGADSAPRIDGGTYRELARAAATVEKEQGADASMTLFAWAARTGDYAKATQAVQALYRGSGARALMREHFNEHVDLDAASESDRALLRCVYGDPETDAASR